MCCSVAGHCCERQNRCISTWLVQGLQISLGCLALLAQAESPHFYVVAQDALAEQLTVGFVNLNGLLGFAREMTLKWPLDARLKLFWALVAEELSDGLWNSV